MAATCRVRIEGRGACKSPVAVPIPPVYRREARSRRQSDRGQPVRLAGTPSIHLLVSVALVPHVLVEVPAVRLSRHQPAVDYSFFDFAKSLSAAACWPF